jgi:hypothetical protein
MALDHIPTTVNDMDRHPAGPLAASLRWGLRWTIAVAALGASAGCVSAVPAEDPIDQHDSYSACVTALGGMPDAVNQHIDPCRAVAAAAASNR